MTRGIPLGDGYLGRYRLDELLGSGGSAEVWRAHDTVADRTVALKMLAPVLTADPEYRRRFEREARAASLLHGPHVMAVHGFGELEGRLFIDSEFVDGLDIEALLEWEGPMSPAAAVDLITQVAEALDEAHAAGLVHRDVKPQNIIVSPDDTAFLIDFGTALQDGQTAITQTGMLVGTPAYMAPERFEGHATPRSDIYSLACVLYECLTGQRPFRVRNPAQLMRAHLELTPKPASAVEPAVPAALDAVLARGLAKNPAERHSSAGEFAEAARAALTGPVTSSPIPLGGPAAAVPPDAPVPDAQTVALSMTELRDRPGSRWTRRRTATAMGFAAAAIAVAVGAAWITGHATEPQPDQRARIPATLTPVAKTPVRATIPPTDTQTPPSDPIEQPAAPSITDTEAAPAWEPAPPRPGPGGGHGPGPGRPGGDHHGDHPGRPPRPN
ncbi:protein kinase [Nocardia sp. ET3-3]|uniref:non-specific serine/threonine protein kinase n=1 Tax=Nocardia terrae TaxID=2675851 RepID=A0A7K1UWF7_9NOCA|nr:serine/threonine-protein kinase [Nocardia terrae]MVU78723.1 protein kinase [Nocardia terrae]